MKKGEHKMKKVKCTRSVYWMNNPWFTKGAVYKVEVDDKGTWTAKDNEGCEVVIFELGKESSFLFKHFKVL